MRRIVLILAPAILASLVLAGCGGVSEDKPLAEVRTEAQAMTVKDIQAIVDKYKSAIESKKAKLIKFKDELSKIPVSELMSDQAKAIKGDIDEVAKSIRALSDRLNVYARELRKKN